MSQSSRGEKRGSSVSSAGGGKRQKSTDAHKDVKKKEVMIKGAWSPDEDEVMKQAVAKYGTDWKAIAKCVRGRTAKQCRDRYKLKLDPSINHGPWSPEEDQTLLKLHGEMGRQWTKIAKLMKGRTENSVKSRFASLQRSKIREWTEEEDKLLWDKREEGCSHEDIAENFLPHRSVHAVKKRYERLYMRELAKKIRSEMPSALKQPSPPQQSLKPKSSFPINPRLVNAPTVPGTALDPNQTLQQEMYEPQLKQEAPPNFHYSPTNQEVPNQGYPFSREMAFPQGRPAAPAIPPVTVNPPPAAPVIPEATHTDTMTHPEMPQPRPRSSRQSKFKRHRTSMTVLMQVIGEPANL